MIEGVNHGFEYDMKIVYSHFPMKATVKGDKFIIENFLGEKAPRHANIVGETKVAVKGTEVVRHRHRPGSGLADRGEHRARHQDQGIRPQGLPGWHIHREKARRAK